MMASITRAQIFMVRYLPTKFVGLLDQTNGLAGIRVILFAHTHTLYYTYTLRGTLTHIL